MPDTDWTIRETEHYRHTGYQVAIRGPAAYRSPGAFRWTQIYTASADAITWDGADGATHAIGSRHGGYIYCRIEVTGRTLQYRPFGRGAVKARITTATGISACPPIVRRTRPGS